MRPFCGSACPATIHGAPVWAVPSGRALHPVPPCVRFHHVQCFVCVHCKVQIGGRRFVALDGEPYLEGCYHKLFGGSAPADVQAAVGGMRRRYAIAVPLSLPSLGGEQALPAFRASHHRLLGSARRELRERGVLDVHTFFSVALSGMPMLLLGLSFRDDADAQVVVPRVGRGGRSSPTRPPAPHLLAPPPPAHVPPGHVLSGGAASCARAEPAVRRVEPAHLRRARPGTVAGPALVGRHHARATVGGMSRLGERVPIRVEEGGCRYGAWRCSGGPSAWAGEAQH